MRYFIYHGGVTPVGTRNAEILLSEAVRDGLTEVGFHINSLGGDVCSGIGLANFIRSLPLTVNTHNFGICGSVAVNIYLAGKTRSAAPVSLFSLHAATLSDPNAAGAIAPSTQLIVAPFRDELNWDQARLDHYFTTGDDKYLSPADACAMGLAHATLPAAYGLADELVHVAL